MSKIDPTDPTPPKFAPLRPILHSLLFEKDGDLNTTQIFVCIMGLVGSIGFFVTVVWRAESSIFEKVLAWTFLMGAFTSVLIASLPLAKAKILANSTLPGELTKDIASLAPYLKEVQESTDVQEIAGKAGDVG